MGCKESNQTNKNKLASIDRSSLSTISLKKRELITLPRPNTKKLSVFWVTGLKILGRIGTHIFFNYLFSGKKYNFMHFERHLAFQNA